MMPDEQSPAEQTLSLGALEGVNVLCLRFEETWQSGKAQPRVEDFLEGVSPALRPALLAELLKLEIYLRRQAGENLIEAEYLTRFPDDAELIRSAFAEDETTRVQSSFRANTPLPSAAVSGFPIIPGYDILGELGRGGMGVVYKAQQTGLKRLVALKLIRPGGEGNAEVLTRFRKEAEAVARLRHPNIVQIYEVSDDDARLYFAMEYVEGGGLDRKLRERLPGHAEAADIVETVARAVHAVHQCGVIHRDLKPANVLLTAEGAPKLGDFGLAKRLDEDAGQTASGQVLGTPSYMAPEQASGNARAVTPAADVYALGAILYECLTGRPPFRAATWEQTLRQVLEDEPVAPCKLNKAVPRDLETICLKCLEKLPQSRYAGAAALAEDLRRFRAGESVLARPTGRAAKVLKWARRRPAAAALFLVSVIATAVLAGMIGRTAFLVHEHNLDLEQVNTKLVKERDRAEEAEQKAKDLAQEAIEERTRAETALHAIRLESARQAWERHDVARAEQLLDEVPAPFQATWEYRHLRTLIRRKALPLRGHTDRVFAICCDRDGARVASAGADKTVKIWDAVTGRELQTLSGHLGSVLSVCFSPDGERLACAGGDQTGKGPGQVRIWDLVKGKVLRSLEGHDGAVLSVCFSPDGTRLATAGFDGIPRVWDARTGEVVLALKGHKGQVTSVCFDADGKRLATGGYDRTTRIWNAATGKQLQNLGEQANAVFSVCFSPNGKLLATGNGAGSLASVAALSKPGEVHIWDAQTGKALVNLAGHTGPVLSVSFSHDSSRLASAGADGSARVWNVRTGEHQFTLRGHTNTVRGVVFRPGGKGLATAAVDNTPRLWNPSTVPPVLTLKGGAGVFKPFLFSPDGQKLVIAGLDKTVKLWDVSAGRLLLTLEDFTAIVVSMSFSPDGARLATQARDGTLRLWDMRTGKAVALNPLPGPVHPPLFSPVGRTLATTGKADVNLWDASTGELGHTFAGQGRPAFSPDGKRLATQGVDGTVSVWDTATGEKTLVLRGHKFTQACFSPDGKRLVTGTEDKEVKVWDATTGGELGTLGNLKYLPMRFAFSPDGKHVLASGATGLLYQTKVWHVASRRQILDLQTTSVCFHPKEPRLAALEEGLGKGSGLRSVRVWDLLTAQAVFSLGEASRPMAEVHFSADGHHLAAMDTDGTVRVWYGGPDP